MKKTIILSLFITVSVAGLCQLEFKNSNVGRTLEFQDIDGRTLLKKYDPSVNGSPFIMEDWVPAKVTLARGKVIGPIPVKLNIESNELYFKDANGNELITLNGLARKIDCVNYYSKDGIKYVFKSGYPKIDAQDENYFYQVYTEGKIELLAKKYKYISSVKDSYTGETAKDFVDGAVLLYVFTNNAMQPFRGSKNAVLELMKDKEKPISDFIDTNKINFKKMPDLKKLFDYYNSL